MKYLLLAFLALAFTVSPAFADDRDYKPDDKITYDVSAEDWVTTKTAHVTVNVEAAVTGSSAGTLRADMVKAVNDVAKGDWRLTSFDRSQDQTGIEHWSAVFEARLPENELTGLNDIVKKLSKPGLQLTVNDIDFSPTLDEMEAARSSVRTQIYKLANDQLTAINTALPGRTYRISSISFVGDGPRPVMMPQVVRGPMMMKASAGMVSDETAPAPVQPASERAEKVTLSARVTFAAVAPTTTPAPTK